jgi:hypothetical protein
MADYKPDFYQVLDHFIEPVNVREYYNPIMSGFAFRRKIAGQFFLESIEPSD